MTYPWLTLRGRLDRPIEESELPQAWVERVAGASDEDRVVILLRQISPLSTRLAVELVAG